MKDSKQVRAYSSPLCKVHAVTVPSVFCASFSNEEYEGNVNYDDGSEDKGWY